MKKLIAFFLMLCSWNVFGSHIVGGEFEIIHIFGFKYEINLIVYFDEVNGDPGNKDQDQFITARIFRYADGSWVRDVTLALEGETDVNYTQPDCAIAELKTSRMFYTTAITMPAETFGDAEGYYIVWERCCRNYEITNIFSDVPPGGIAAGQTFYLHFPPVVKNGEPFVNSSPVLFPPLSDYACVGKPYYADFTGTDADGDSLVYTLVTPFSTHTFDPYPPINPKPYPEITWRPGYSLNNVLKGNPDLKISTDGLLTVTPGSTQGLFVFAVKCEEFRDGEKIGEVRRDFQMFVVDCKVAVPPVVKGRKLGDAAFAYEGEIAVNFSNNVTDDDRCIEVEISDADVQGLDKSERIKLRVVPIGFKGDVSDMLPTVTSALLLPTSPTWIARICFDKCPYNPDGNYKVGLIAGDDACSLPLLDTLIINVTIEPPDNGPAQFTTPGVDATLQEGDAQSWPISGFDVDQDSVYVNVISGGFSFEDAGFSITSVVNQDGNYDATLNWDANCTVYDFTQQTDFDFKIIIDDVDECEYFQPDILDFSMHIELPGNSPPSIGTNLSLDEMENGVDVKMFEEVNFIVDAFDDDGDPLTLTMLGQDFDTDDYDITFPGGTGIGTVSSPFEWPIKCDALPTDGSRYTLKFFVHDQQNKCRFNYTDTVTVDVNISPPDNIAPTLTVTSLNPAVPLENGKLNMTIPSEARLKLVGTDGDELPADMVKLELVDITGTITPQGYSFTPAEALRRVESEFVWAPDCGIFAEGFGEKQATFTFRAIDQRCMNPDTAFVSVDMTLNDIASNHGEFLPPNFITPNDDGCNDYFAFEDYNGAEERVCGGGEINEPKLPLDNCSGHFTSIRIYNRWGKQVFQSNQRNFRWYAKNEAAGVYYYTVLYDSEELKSEIEYKGSITVRF